MPGRLIVSMFLALGLANVPARAEPAAYAAREVRGTVVDEQTGEPLEGVVVVAQWELVREVIPGLRDTAPGERLRIEEAVTGHDGRYAIPAWGPLPRPAFTRLEHRDPQLSFFKAGYYPWTVANEVRGTPGRQALRVSQWDGKTIRLVRVTGQAREVVLEDGRFKTTVRLDGTLRQYASWVRDLQISLQWTRDNDDWKRYPRMVLALKRERERLQAAGLDRNHQIDRTGSLHGGAQAVDRFLGAPEK